MKIYRVEYYLNSDSSQGFSFHTSKTEAYRELKKFAKDNGLNYDSSRSCVSVQDVKLNKTDLIGILTQWGRHPDNG